MTPQRPGDTPAVLADRIEMVNVDAVTSHPRNARRGNIAAIVDSYRANGMFAPIVVQRSTGFAIDGNHRLAAAKAIGMPTIPVVYVDIDDDRALRILLVANRTNDLAGYDNQMLTELLTELEPVTLDGTGYDTAALNDLLAELSTPDKHAGMSPPDRGTPLDLTKTVTKRGDLWTVGDHRVLCGDSRNADDVARVMDGKQINVAFTSPPYAVQRAYDTNSGFEPISPDDYVAWFEPVAANVAGHLAPDGSWFVNIKPTADGLDTQTYVLDLVLAHAREWGWHWATEFCWERNCPPKRVVSRFKNQFEPIYQFARGAWKIRPEAVRHQSDNVPVAHGPDSGISTDWTATQGNPGADIFAGRRVEGLAYPGNRLPTFAATHQATGHPAAFPVGLPEWFIRAYTDIGDTIYDPFTGSGSTLVAAHNQHRAGHGIELSPAYVDVTIARLEQATGLKAKRHPTKTARKTTRR